MNLPLRKNAKGSIRTPKTSELHVRLEDQDGSELWNWAWKTAGVIVNGGIKLQGVIDAEGIIEAVILSRDFGEVPLYANNILLRDLITQ